MDRSTENNFQVESLTEVVTDLEDCKNVRDFFTHFKIHMPDYLNSAIVNYEAVLETTRSFTKEEKTVSKKLLEAQNIFRVSLCKAMVESDHPLFKDELFKTVIGNSEEVVFCANFDEQIGEALTSTES